MCGLGYSVDEVIAQEILYKRLRVSARRAPAEMASICRMRSA